MCAVGKHLNLLFASRKLSPCFSLVDALKIAVDKQLNLKIKQLFFAKRLCVAGKEDKFLNR